MQPACLPCIEASMQISLPFETNSFVDVDSVANVRTRRSLSGSAIFLAGTPFNQKFKLQLIFLVPLRVYYVLHVDLIKK